jgi:hypothetical protein
MRRSDYNKLLDHGRKAGLHTGEIYQALATRQMEAHDNSNRQADGNGFVSDQAPGGHRVYRPLGGAGPA